MKAQRSRTFAFESFIVCIFDVIFPFVACMRALYVLYGRSRSRNISMLLKAWSDFFLTFFHCIDVINT